MKTLSVLASEKKVLEHCAKTLFKRKFKNIRVSYGSLRINAERRKFFFLSGYRISLAVKQINEAVTNLELTVNPHHLTPTFMDKKKEQELESNFLIYL